MHTLPYGEKISPPLLSSQKTAVLIDNHPADSKVEIVKDDVCQTLSARMGTGGGNVPLLMEITNECYSQSGFADYKENNCVTLRASGGDLGGGSENLVISDKVSNLTDRSHTEITENFLNH